MGNSWIFREMPEKEERKARKQAAQKRLYEYQLEMKEKKLSVLVLVEGWGAAGKGKVIGEIIKNIDPRFFNVDTLAEPSEEETRRPFLYRYMVKIPEEGKFEFLDSGWVEQIVKERFSGSMSEEVYQARMGSIRCFERQLKDQGYLLVKLFFDISKKEQKKRFQHLKADPDTKWRVSAWDKEQNRHYETCRELFEQCVADTDMPETPWHLIDASDVKWAELQAMEILCESLETALENCRKEAPLLPNTFPLVEMPALSQVDLTAKVSRETYKRERKELQARLQELHNRLYRKKVPVIIAYEGWDAAGKGGNIKRLTEAMDPRGFEVHPIASPEPHEKARHYLWRFWTRLPKTGHIAVFDRTWYGRVMVERLEGFCSENDWKRAYREINEFEKELHDWGAVIIKFWVQIDKDTQLKRFQDREKTPEKNWKITEEDWRNREKWDEYEVAVNEMIQKTSTVYAPWHILPSVDKKYARLLAMKIVIAELEKVLFLSDS